MTAALQATIAVSVMAALVESGGLGVADHTINFSPNNVLANGTGANQANQVYSASRSLAASVAESLDLSGGLTNALGTSLVFTTIKALLVRAASTNTNDVIVGGAAVNGFWASLFGAATETVKVHPGGMFLITAPNAAGIPVTAGTADLLKLANSAAGTPVDYDIVVIGTV